MKKYMYVLCATILLLFNLNIVKSQANNHLAAFDKTEFKTVYKVSASQIVIKEEPNASSKTVGTEKRGTYFITEYAANNGWLPVMYKGNYYFVNIGGIAFDLPSTIKVSSSKGGIVIKESPTPNSKTVTGLQYGMVITDFGDAGNGYSFVQYGNVIGYAKTSFMAAPTATVKYTTTTTEIRPIASPSVDGSLIFSGTKVKHYTTIKGWAYVEDEAAGLKGYVPVSELATKDPNAVSVAPTKPSTPAPSQGSYKNCTELKKDFPGGVYVGHWAYEVKMDRDRDGHACE